MRDRRTNAAVPGPDGRTLALLCANGPRDVHWPVWEMHPEGDELLVLVSGSLSVELQQDEGERTVALPAQATFIVPAGTWHRLVVHGPCVLIALTPRRGTVHAKRP